MDELLSAALDCLRAGDAAGLSARLDADRDLVRARVPGAEPPYDGYFHRATLLHHVSGNPAVTPLPANAAALAALLLDRGAEVDAVTEAGPSQPADIGWTTLGLVASSGVAREAGIQRELIDLLVARGADVDARGGGTLMGALYYRELRAARRLTAHGADVDLVAAAALGDLAALERHVGADGALTADAHRLAHYSLVPLPARETPAEVLGLALCYASMHGQLAAAERLIALGADPSARPPFDHRATPLHWAAAGDQPECVRALLARGADPEARDASFHSTPRGWAQHMGRARALAALG